MKEVTKQLASEFMLTTVDNPYNPFIDFDSWFMYDVSQGYNSCGYLARIALTSDSLSDSEYNAEIERAIDEIIKYDPLNIYRKVKRGSPFPPKDVPA